MTCISNEITQWIVAAVGPDELTDRIRYVVANLPKGCLSEMSEAIDVPIPTIYGFSTGRTVAPPTAILEKYLLYLAPGYTLCAVKAERQYPACPVVPIGDAPPLMRPQVKMVLAPISSKL